MTKWEYDMTYLFNEDSSLDGRLKVLELINELGADGWEIAMRIDRYAIFKRLVPESIRMEAGCGCTEAVLSPEEVLGRCDAEGAVR